MLKNRLERIIEIKEKIIEDKEREIEEEKVRLDTVNHEIENVNADIERTYNTITTKALKGSDFSVIRDFLEYLENTKNALLREKESVLEKIVILKQELVELMKEAKMLGTLRAKVLNTLKKASNRREQKLLDGIALRIEEKKI
jgi:flagellar biosynthesis chaperone FliJ